MTDGLEDVADSYQEDQADSYQDHHPTTPDIRLSSEDPLEAPSSSGKHTAKISNGRPVVCQKRHHHQRSSIQDSDREDQRTCTQVF